MTSSMSTVWLVASREIAVRIKSKAFLAITAIFVVLIVVGGVVLKLVNSGENATKIAYGSATSQVAATVQAAAEAAGVTVETVEGGEQQVRDGDVDVLVDGTPQQMTLVVNKTIDPTVQSILTQVSGQAALSDQIQQLGGDPTQVATAIVSAQPTLRTLDASADLDPAQLITGMITGILLMMSIMMGGQFVAQGVVEEKTSRVVELLLAAIRPWQLMAGKILGIGIVSLIQVVAVVGAGVGTAVGLGLVDTSSINLGVAALWALLWFIVGFAMYSLLLGALAALVSRQEDVSSVIMPVVVLMMIPYFVGVSVAPMNPGSPLVVGMSYVPFCSPLLMPIRYALGSVSAAQVLLALAISLAVIPVLVWLTGKIYSNAVLRTGSRIKLRDALHGA